MKKFIKLKPSQIGTDPRYQRDFDEGRAKAMARKIDPDLLGVPVVSKRPDGTYVAVDAQHRIGACKIAGYDEPILCEAHEGMSVDEEASLFIRLNGGRSAVRMFDKFKAKLVAKDPTSLEIAAIVKAAGLRITKAPANKGVCAIQAVIGVFHRGNLKETLSTLVAWSDGEAAFLEGILIRSISLFLGKYPEVDIADFVKKLAPFSAERVISKLKRMQGAFADVSPTVAACSVFRDIYNVRRSKKSQLPPLDSLSETAEPVAAE